MREPSIPLVICAAPSPTPRPRVRKQNCVVRGRGLRRWEGSGRRCGRIGKKLAKPGRLFWCQRNGSCGAMKHRSHTSYKAPIYYYTKLPHNLQSSLLPLSHPQLPHPTPLKITRVWGPPPPTPPRTRRSSEDALGTTLP